MCYLCKTVSYWIVFVICLTRHWAQLVYYCKTCICISYLCVYKALQHRENEIILAIRNSTYVSYSCSLFHALWLFPKWFLVSPGHFSHEFTDVTLAPFLPCWGSPQPCLHRGFTVWDAMWAMPPRPLLLVPADVQSPNGHATGAVLYHP